MGFYLICFFVYYINIKYELCSTKLTIEYFETNQGITMLERSFSIFGC